MAKTPKQFDKLSLVPWALGIAATIVIGWAGWLSVRVVSLGENNSSNTSVLAKIEGRIDRIAQRLPTELALNTQEVIHRRITSALIVGESFVDANKLYRVVSVYDGTDGKLTTGAVEVLEKESAPTVGMGVLFAKNRSDSAATFAQIELFGRKYQINYKNMPAFIDKDYSIVSDLPAGELAQIMFKQAKWKSVGHVYGIPTAANYEALASALQDRKKLFEEK